MSFFEGDTITYVENAALSIKKAAKTSKWTQQYYRIQEQYLKILRC